MNLTLLIILGMLALSIAAPFVAIYAVSLIRKNGIQAHARIQKRLFWTCVLGVLILEIQIRVSGGSSSLVANGSYTDAPFFRPILIAHIVGAVLTYLAWAVQLFMASIKRKVAGALPGSFSAVHRRLGYVTIAGLFYTAITALVVCMLAFFL